MAALITPRTWALLDPLSDTNLNAGIRDAIQQLLPIRAVSSADTARASTTTLAVDPFLQVAVAANAEYDFKMQLFYFQGATGQLVAKFSGPTSATLDWSAWMLDQGVTASNTGSIRPLKRLITDTLTFGGNLSVACSALVSGRIQTFSTAGTFSFLWAQSVSNATAVTVQSGSFMTLQQIA